MEFARNKEVETKKTKRNLGKIIKKFFFFDGSQNYIPKLGNEMGMKCKSFYRYDK